MLHKRMVFGLVVMGMICFFGKGVGFGEPGDPEITLVNTLYGHSDRVWSVSFSPDGRYLASGSDDNTVKLWKISTPPPISISQSKI